MGIKYLVISTNYCLKNMYSLTITHTLIQTNKYPNTLQKVNILHINTVMYTNSAAFVKLHKISHHILNLCYARLFSHKNGLQCNCCPLPSTPICVFCCINLENFWLSGQVWSALLKSSFPLILMNTYFWYHYLLLALVVLYHQEVLPGVSLHWAETKIASLIFFSAVEEIDISHKRSTL